MSLRQRLIALGAGATLAASAAFIGQKEGLSLVPYDDVGGVPTWCYGETVGHQKARYSLQECDTLLLKRVQGFAKGVEELAPRGTPASVRAALTSVAYNVGLGGIKHPVIMEPLARGDWYGTCAALEAPWRGKHGVAKGFKATVAGKPVRGLELRRKAEAALCREDL